MWIEKLIPSRPKSLPLNPPSQNDDTLSVAAVSRQHQAAISNMVTALRRSDFVEARKHSNEEIRLKRLLNTLKA
jgi:hypothetical protein